VFKEREIDRFYKSFLVMLDTKIQIGSRNDNLELQIKASRKLIERLF